MKSTEDSSSSGGFVEPSGEALSARLEARLHLHAGELAMTVRLALLFACEVGAFMVGRSARDALFLAHVHANRLPPTYIAAALTVGVVSYPYSRIADRFRRDQLLGATAGIMALSLVVFRLAIGSGTWLYYALYVWVEVIGAIIVIQFWTLAQDLHTAREAKRVFGLIGVGGPLANVVFGFAIVGFARRLGADNLLLLSAALLLAASYLVVSVGRRAVVPRPARRSNRRSARTGASKSLTSPHLRWTAVVIFLTFLTSTVIDFQFKAITAHHLAENRDAMAQFFGLFFAVTGVVALVVELGLTRHCLKRYGVIAGLAMLPLATAMGSALLLAAPALWAATLAKAPDNCIRYTVNDASLQLLYLPVPGEVRGHTKAFLEGMLKPFTIALAGAALVGYQRVTAAVRPLSLVALGCIALWLLALMRLRPKYRQAITATLRRRRVDLGSAHLVPEDLVSVLRGALTSPDARQVSAALDLASELETNLSEVVAPLVHHDNAVIRRRACQYLAERPSADYAGHFVALIDDREPAVAATAVSGLCAALRADALPLVRDLATSDRPEVRAAAIAGVLEHGGARARIEGAGAVERTLADSTSIERAQVATILSAVGAEASVPRLAALLRDPDVAVRRAAIRAAGELRAAGLVPALLRLLRDHDLVADVIDALGRCGPGSEEAVDALLDDADQQHSVRIAAARVLGRVATPAAARSLSQHLDAESSGLRHAVDHALVEALRRQRGSTDVRQRVRVACLNEAHGAIRALSLSERLAELVGSSAASRRSAAERYAPAGPLLSGALSETVEGATKRIFLLLATLYPASEIELLQDNLRADNPHCRANAVEVLDLDLDRTLKRVLVPLLEDAPTKAKLRELAPQPGTTDCDELLAELLCDEDPWVQACAALLAGELSLTSTEERLRALLNNRHPIVRDAADVALRLIERANEEHEQPRGLGTGALTRAGADVARPRKSESEATMITNLEKVLGLKGVELFTALPGNELAAIALIAEEVHASEGEELVKEGDDESSLFLIIEGSVRVRKGTKSIAECHAGEVFGEMALLDPAPRSATVIAISDVTMLRISRDDFTEIMSERPTISQEVIKVLTRRLREATSVVSAL